MSMPPQSAQATRGFQGQVRRGRGSSLPASNDRAGDAQASLVEWVSSETADGNPRDGGTPGRLAGPISVWIDGDILNAGELRAQLGLGLDASEARVVLEAWHRWAEAAVGRLSGVFAFVLSAGDDVILYLDPSGLSKLYYQTNDNGTLVFGTNLGGLLQRHGGEARVVRAAAHEFLRFLDIAAPNALIERVRAVEPGQLLRWTRHGMETLSVSTPVLERGAVPDFADAVNVLDRMLRRAVAASMAASIRPACFLSGGVDSALLCAMGARQRPGLTALTIGFEGTQFDETPLAERIASHLGVPHRVLRFDRQQYLEAFDRLSQSMDQPMADPATMATVLAFDHCKEHFDVVLDGTGADEAVGAMPPRHVRLAVGYASLLPAALRRLLVRALSSVPGLAGYTPILDFEHPADTMIRWRGFTRLEIEELCGEPVSFEHTQFYRTFARFPRHAHYDRYSALLGTMSSDRLTQATLVSGMKVRYPFCDRETDSFLRQLPTEWRHLPGQPKRILRALLARYVPREIWDTPKHSFDFPLQDFLAGDDFALVRRYVVNGTWLDRGLLRPDVVRRHARQYMEGDSGKMFRVWALVVLGAWLEKHEDLT